MKINTPPHAEKARFEYRAIPHHSNAAHSDASLCCKLGTVRRNGSTTCISKVYIPLYIRSVGEDGNKLFRDDNRLLYVQVAYHNEEVLETAVVGNVL